MREWGNGEGIKSIISNTGYVGEVHIDGSVSIGINAGLGR